MSYNCDGVRLWNAADPVDEMIFPRRPNAEPVFRVTPFIIKNHAKGKGLHASRDWW